MFWETPPTRCTDLAPAGTGNQAGPENKVGPKHKAGRKNKLDPNNKVGPPLKYTYIYVFPFAHCLLPVCNTFARFLIFFRCEPDNKKVRPVAQEN